METLTDYFEIRWGKIILFIYLFLKFLLSFNYSCVPFLPIPPPHPSWTHLHPPPWFCPCVLYSSSCNPLSSLSPPHSPLAIVRLFLTSMSLVIFCLLFSFVDYVLCSREKEGAYTLCNSMDGTVEHYVKWNKPGSEGQIPYDLTFNWNIINKRKKQRKYNQRHWS